MNLYQLSADYQRLLDNTFDHETGEIDQVSIERLDQMKSSIEDKGIALASYIKNIEAEEIAIDAAITRMIDRRNKLTKRSSYLTKYLQKNMENCNINKISNPYILIKLKKCQMSVDIIDENKIPEQYKKKKESITIDRNKLKRDMLEGSFIDGASLIQKNRIEIK